MGRLRATFTYLSFNVSPGIPPTNFLFASLPLGTSHARAMCIQYFVFSFQNEIFPADGFRFWKCFSKNLNFSKTQFRKIWEVLIRPKLYGVFWRQKIVLGKSKACIPTKARKSVLGIWKIARDISVGGRMHWTVTIPRGMKLNSALPNRARDHPRLPLSAVDGDLGLSDGYSIKVHVPRLTSAVRSPPPQTCDTAHLPFRYCSQKTWYFQLYRDRYKTRL